MTVAASFALPDHAVLARLDTLARDEHQRTAETLELLGTLDARRLYAAAGYPSLRAYCCERLRYSEDVAEQRIRAARLAARFPRALERIADARLSVSTLLMLARHLTAANADELLAAASGCTRLEVQTLLAARFPRADLPTVVHELSRPGASRRSVACHGGHALATLRGDVTTLQPVPERVEIGRELASSSVQVLDFELTSPPSQEDVAAPRVPAQGRIEPLSEGRVGVQFTMRSHVLGKLRFARALLGHAVPSGDMAQVFECSLDALIAALERRRFGVGARSRGARGAAASIPAEVRAEVYVRDGGRCTFASDDGHRCGCDTRLEYDHVVLVAHGGTNTTANLRLRCQAHNQWEAERVLGAGFMQAKRDEARARRAGRRALGPARTATNSSPRPSRADSASRAPSSRDETRALAPLGVERPTSFPALAPDATTDITNALRHLGARREEIRHALDRTAHLADAPLKTRLLAALRTLRPAGVKTLRPDSAGRA